MRSPTNADNGLPEGDHTRLYFPADQHQMRAVVKRVFGDSGLRFVFSTRSPVPDILGSNGQPLFGGGYQFVPGKDEVIREGTAGYVVSYGEILRIFFSVATDPTQVNQQYPDEGPQYRSIIFYHNDEQHKRYREQRAQTQRTLGTDGSGCRR